MWGSVNLQQTNVNNAPSAACLLIDQVESEVGVFDEHQFLKGVEIR